MTHYIAEGSFWPRVGGKVMCPSSYYYVNFMLEWLSMDGEEINERYSEDVVYHFDTQSRLVKPGEGKLVDKNMSILNSKRPFAKNISHLNFLT